MAEKIYCGFGKTFGEYGSIKVSINVKDRDGNQIIKANEKGWINLIVTRRREPDQRGNEFSVQLDTFQPKPKTAEQQPEQTDDLPF